ncbi:MAG TPA: ABC-type transport auxiliary lipoprotein family protein [Candidatus Acidoferrales bacterium]|nr:ABC-type transport auxiliary lipoprotein family protein [Candidatus Acidoferrales bacterium]
MSIRASEKMRDAFLIFLIAVFSASCGAARPIKYYALNVPEEPPQDGPSQFPVSLLVARVAAGHLYRDSRLVYRTNNLELGTYEYQRWSEPAVDMIQKSLVASLRATKQYRSVDPVASNLRGDYIVRAQLDALDEIDKAELAARFSLRLELYDPKSAVVLWSDSYTHDQAVQGKKVLDVIGALDANVKGGMEQLTASLGRYFASRPSPAH